jgi:hypothetical protein
VSLSSASFDPCESSLDLPASLQRRSPVWSDDLGGAPEGAAGGALISNDRQIPFEEEPRLSLSSGAWRFRPSSSLRQRWPTVAVASPVFPSIIFAAEWVRVRRTRGRARRHAKDSSSRKRGRRKGPRTDERPQRKSAVRSLQEQRDHRTPNIARIISPPRVLSFQLLEEVAIW